MLYRRRAVLIAAIAGVVLALCLFSIVLWAGNSLKSRNPLSALTHEKAEELLSQMLNQPVQIGKVSFLSFNRVLLEDITSLPLGGNSPQDGKPGFQGSGQGSSLRISRVIVGIDMWQYLREKKVTSLTVQVHQPHFEIQGPFLPFSREGEARDVLGLGYIDVEVTINDGRLTYSGTGLSAPLVLENLSGTVSLGLKGSGTGETGLEIDHLQFSWGAHRLDLQGEVVLGKGSGTGIHVNLLCTSKDLGRLSLVGCLDSSGPGELELSVGVEDLALAQLFSMTEIILQGSAPGITIDLGSLDGLLNGHWEIEGRRERLRWEGDFRVSQLSYEAIPLGGLEGTVTFDGENLRFSTLEGSILGSRITGQGLVTVGADYHLHLNLRGINPAKVPILTKVWESTLPAAISRNLEDLEVMVHLHRGEDLSEIEADWQTVWLGEAARGTVSISLDGGYRASAQWETDSLVDVIQHIQHLGKPVQGRLQVDVRLSGDSESLQGEGLLTITEGKIGNIAFSGKATVALRDRELEVKSLVLEEAGGGVVTGVGTILWEDPSHPVLDLAGKVSEVAYSSGPLAGRVSGDIFLAGSWPQPLLKGRLSLEQGSFELGKLGQTGNVAFTSVDLPLAVDIEMNDSLKVAGMGMLNLTASGALHIGGSSKSPSFRGRIEAERGQVIYLGTPFEIVKGWAEFWPYQGVIPEVYLEGSSNVKGTMVTLILQGPGDNLEPILKSEEGLSQEELLSMLGIPAAVNMVLDEGLGTAIRREMGRLLGVQLEQHLLGNLERRLEAALGLDELKLEPGLSDGRVKLELGKYISDGIFLAYTQTVYPHWENQWHVDYKLSDKLRLNTTWDGDGEYQLGLEMRIAF